MTAHGVAMFDTAIGRCGIAWGGRGVLGVQLPEASELETRARVLRRFPDADQAPPPPGVQRAIDGVVALLSGEPSDLSGVALDMDRVPPFHRRVYEVVRTIPPGVTCAYGEVAARLGSPDSARAVGQALARNPFAIVVPCHRVVAAGGKVGGFSANGGITTKLRLLAIERARADGEPTLFGPGVFGFDPAVAVERLRACDPALARVIDAVGPFDLRLKKAPSVFVALAEAIVYQQLTAKAAATIFARLCALFPHAHDGPTAGQVLRASDEGLRAAGLSRSKLLALRDLARRAASGEIPGFAEIDRMTDEVVIERLTEVRGIGRWTAQMFLIFHLGRPDVLPVDDYAVRRGFAIAFEQRELPARKDLEGRGARWQPYRTAASWYLWRTVELAKQDPPV